MIRSTPDTRCGPPCCGVGCCPIFSAGGLAAGPCAVVTTDTEVTPGKALTLPGERAILLDALRDKHEGWLPGYMAAGVA